PVGARAYGHAPRRIGDELDGLALLLRPERFQLRRRAHRAELLLRPGVPRALVLCALADLVLPVWGRRSPGAAARGARRHPADAIGLDAAPLLRAHRHADCGRAAGVCAVAAVLHALLAPRRLDCAVGVLDGAGHVPLYRHRPPALPVPAG